MKTGVYNTLSRADYDALQRLNWSRLKHIGRSPAHYLHALNHKAPDKDVFRLGRCAHLATLEPEVFESLCVVWMGRRAGKAWEAFEEENAGKEILKSEEHDFCLAVARACRSDPSSARYLLAGHSEVSVTWEDPAFKMLCKARLDFVADVGALVDLKTTRDAGPDGFGREVWRLRYHTQAALYSDGYAAATGKRLPYVLIAVEKEPPHVVQVYRVPEAVIELGREDYRVLMGRLTDCQRDNVWGGYASGEQELTLPKWAVDFGDDDDLTDLGLVAG